MLQFFVAPGTEIGLCDIYSNSVAINRYNYVYAVVFGDEDNFSIH